MKASELRIGNWINFDNLIGGQVNGRDINSNYQVTPRFFKSSLEDNDFEINGYYKPILITEDWLLKFGFKKLKETEIEVYKYKTSNSSLYFILFHYENLWRFGFDGIQSHCFTHFKYVHQLQNLYFVLTGEELVYNAL